MHMYRPVHQKKTTAGFELVDSKFSVRVQTIWSDISLVGTRGNIIYMICFTLVKNVSLLMTDVPLFRQIDMKLYPFKWHFPALYLFKWHFSKAYPYLERIFPDEPFFRTKMYPHKGYVVPLVRPEHQNMYELWSHQVGSYGYPPLEWTCTLLNFQNNRVSCAIAIK